MLKYVLDDPKGYENYFKLQEEKRAEFKNEMRRRPQDSRELTKRIEVVKCWLLEINSDISQTLKEEDKHQHKIDECNDEMDECERKMIRCRKEMNGCKGKMKGCKREMDECKKKMDECKRKMDELAKEEDLASKAAKETRTRRINL